MEEVLAVLAIVAAGTVAAAVTVVLVVRWRLRRRNRVSPGQRTLAPLWWLVAPTRSALLHRRLRSLVSVAQAVAPLSATGAEMAATVEAHAVSIDRRLVLASRLRGQRTAALGALGRQVDELEAVTARLARLVEADRQPARLPADRPALTELADRLDALEAARGELAYLEADAGLAN